MKNRSKKLAKVNKLLLEKPEGIRFIISYIRYTLMGAGLLIIIYSFLRFNEGLLFPYEYLTQLLFYIGALYGVEQIFLILYQIREAAYHSAFDSVETQENEDEKP